MELILQFCVSECIQATARSHIPIKAFGSATTATTKSEDDRRNSFANEILCMYGRHLNKLFGYCIYPFACERNGACHWQWTLSSCSVHQRFFSFLAKVGMVWPSAHRFEIHSPSPVSGIACDLYTSPLHPHTIRFSNQITKWFQE